MSWRGLDHRTVYEMVVHGGQGIGVADAAESGWRSAHQAVLDADGVISGALLASRSEWQGTGADAMRTAFSPLAQWALHAATSAGGTAGGVGGQAVLAMETRRLVADNAPPQTFVEHLVDVVGDWEGGSPYDESAAAVDRLMTGYEAASAPNEQRFDTWSVPPTVVVAAAGAGSSGPGGGVAALPDTGGLGPAGGSGIAAALAPGHGAAGPVGSAVPGAAGYTAPAAGAGVLPGAAAPLSSGSAVSGGSGVPGTVGGVGAGGAGAGGTGAGGLGAGGAGAGGAGLGAAGAGRLASGGSGPGGRGLGTGGVTHPSLRRPGSPGGSGTGPGPWSRSGTEAGRPAAAPAFRPVVQAVPPRASTPDWRTVLLPPEREVARAPGEAATRSGAPALAQSAAQGPGTRAAGSPGTYAPMMGGGGSGGAQGEGRRRASYLIDDSDAFVDHRWVQPAVITPEDLIPDEYGRLPGQ